MPDELPYDPADPPLAPPPGAIAGLWWLAHRLREEHRPRPDGLCGCGESPCDGAQFADEQLRLACHAGRAGRADDESPARRSEPREVPGHGATADPEQVSAADDPLATPPADAEPDVARLWRAAYELRQDHQPGAEGRCGNCGQASPCTNSRFADYVWRLARKQYARQRLRAAPPDPGRAND